MEINIGSEYGYLTVIESYGTIENSNEMCYRTKCICGNEIIVASSTLLSSDNTLKSCGCMYKRPDLTQDVINRRLKAKKEAEDMKGHQFGAFFVKDIHEIIDTKDDFKIYLDCVCEHGVDYVFEKNYIKNERTKGCPCPKYNCSNKRFVRIYNAMRHRCNSTNDDSYANYGGRGITYDPRWENFDNFRDDMYESYLSRAAEVGDEHLISIDRKDVDGNYCKENCQWSTYEEQANNKRFNNKYECYGKYDTARNIYNAYVKDPNVKFDTFRKQLASGKYTDENNKIIDYSFFKSNLIRSSQKVNPCIPKEVIKI